MEDLLNILEKVVSFCEHRGALAEVLGAWRKETIVTLERNDIKLCINQHVAGVGIRTLIDNSVGFASCNSLDEEVVKKTAERAIRMSKKTPPLPFITFSSPGHFHEISGLYDPEVHSFDEADAVSTAESMMRAAQEDPRVQVDNGEFAASIRKKAICTSSAVSAEEEKSRFSWSLNGMAREGNEVGPYEYHYGCCTHVNQIYVEETGQNLAERAVSDLYPKKIDSFTGDLILGPEGASHLIGDPVISSVNANNVFRGQSVLAQRLEEKVTSPIVTIRDNALLPGEPSSSKFDREGTPHQNLTIVEKGVLKTFLYNSLAAKRDSHSNTGNATGTFRDIPKIGNTNFVVEKTSKNLETLIEEMEGGLIITRFSGVADVISGDFSGAVKGAHFIKRGEIQHPVREATIAGNVFEILPRITDISRETAKYSKMILPFMKISDMQIIA
ncbi:MAG: TldD/PmbA family protein [Theionarchaea archaeon]|nr:TldD/PmbA family protein [Theionarchaea archaeon]